MTAAMGVGAILGGLFVAHRGKTGIRPLTIAAFAFGIAVAFAARPQPGVELVTLALAGGASISFMATGNSTLQLGAEPVDARPGDGAVVRRVPGLDPDRRPIVGAVMAALGARAGLGLGAVTCLVVAAAGLLALRPHGRAPRTSHAPLEE